MSLINRGSNPPPRIRRYSPDELRERQQAREHAAARRKSHHYIGFVCPACGHRQLLEIPLPPGATLGDAPGDIPPGPKTLRTHCEVGLRPEDNLRRRAGVLAVDCQISLQVVLHGPDAMPSYLLAWRDWSRHRYAWEARRDRIAAAADGYYARPETWGHLPAPRLEPWDRPDPPYATFDALRGLLAVRLQEMPPMRKEPLYVDLNLPDRRYIRARVITSHRELADQRGDGNRHQLAELAVPMPLDDGLRASILDVLLADYPEDRRLIEESRKDVLWTFPYGTEAWCWTRGADRHTAAVEVLTAASPEPAAAASDDDAPAPAPAAAPADQVPLPPSPDVIEDEDTEESPAAVVGEEADPGEEPSAAEQRFFEDGFAATPLRSDDARDAAAAAARRQIEAALPPEPELSRASQSWWARLMPSLAVSTDHGESQ